MRGVLGDYAKHLRSITDISLQDLPYTLYARRTKYAVRASISVESATDLLAKIAPNIGLRSKALSNPIRALAVFIGQGAQWLTMGRELILSSPYVRKLVQELDVVLRNLPESERPEWLLMNELTCDAFKSRLHSVVNAQPLCTVIQIILYDLLSSVGFKFQAVVGH